MIFLRDVSAAVGVVVSFSNLSFLRSARTESCASPQSTVHSPCPRVIFRTLNGSEKENPIVIIDFEHAKICSKKS